MTVTDRLKQIATDSDRYTVNLLTACWDWLGARFSSGHAAVRFCGKTTGAYRIFYRYFVGEIPAGHHVHHTCENRMCVNPAHLVAVTPAQHSQFHGKLTRDQVAEIRLLGEADEMSQQTLAQKFGVNQTTISAILLRSSWIDTPHEQYDAAA